jgi:hypothetical protein
MALPQWLCCRQRRGTRTSLVECRRGPNRRPCRPAWFPVGSRLLQSSSRPTLPHLNCCRTALRRRPCCHQRKGTRTSPGERPPRRPSRPAWVPAESRLPRFSSRPTRPQPDRCHSALRQWLCCRRRREPRIRLDSRPPRHPSRPAWNPAGSRLLRFSSRPTLPLPDHCPAAVRQWLCCRRRREPRIRLDSRPPRHPSRPAWNPAGSRLLRFSSRPTLPLPDHCPAAVRQWLCCRRRRELRIRLDSRPPRHPSRPAWNPAGSRLLRFSSRPTLPLPRRCQTALRQWLCCRRRRRTRIRLDSRPPPHPSRPAWNPAGSRLLRFSSRPTLPLPHRCR